MGVFAPHVEIAIAPAVKFDGTAQGLAQVAGVKVFAGMMNQDDGQLELALEFAQEREQPGDLAGVVFIHPAQSDQPLGTTFLTLLDSRFPSRATSTISDATRK